MSDHENIEIRVCLIGEEEVGKKSVISRFKILNSSMTNDYSKESSKESEEHSQKEQKGSLKNPQTDSKKLPSPNETFFTKKYTGREKKKLQSLINFSKFLTISNFSIELKFFPISSADSIDIADKINEEDEALREHKMKFDNIKSEIERVIMKPPSSPFTEVKMLFLFMIDLQNFEASFEKIKIYYDEINKLLNLNRQYSKALIGNKVDIKSMHIDREALNDWIKKEKFNYYEISTKMFFNFEKFFEQLFFHSFESSNPAFSSLYFKERFNYVMTLRPTFSKAERSGLKIDDYPGPQKYDSNVFNLQGAVDVMSGNERFGQKIFINKRGPVFGYKGDEFTKKNKNKEKAKPSSEMNKIKSKEEKDNFKTAEMKKKLKEDMFGHNPGYSMGIKPAAVSLRKVRKEEYKKHMQEFEEMFNLDNITKKKHNERRNLSRANSQDSVLSERKAPEDAKKEALKKKVEEFKQKRKKLKPQIKPVIVEDFTRRSLDSTRSINSNLSMSKQNERRNKNNTNEKKRAQSQRESRSQTIRNNAAAKLKDKIDHIPGPATYDVRTKVDLTKGYTFGGKHQRDENKTNYGPGYLYLESDIEQLAKQPKFASRSFAPRFKKQVAAHPGDSRKIEEKLRNMEENRLMELNRNSNKLREWERKREEALIRKDEKDEFKYRKLEEAILRKEENERNKRLEKGLKLAEPGVINYNLVEDNAPMYTMKGKYDRGFLNTQDNLDDAGRLHGLEQSVSYLSKNLTKNLNPLPNHAAVKANLPSYSISKAERFPNIVSNEFKYEPADIYYEEMPGIIENKPGSYLQAS